MADATNLTTILPDDALMLSWVRSSLELTDACIIDGTEDYVIFAVKIPRQTLRANHHFLRVALEAADDWRPSDVKHFGRLEKAKQHWLTRLMSVLRFAHAA
jgi:hypothetical protein